MQEVCSNVVRQRGSGNWLIDNKELCITDKGKLNFFQCISF